MPLTKKKAARSAWRPSRMLYSLLPAGVTDDGPLTALPGEALGPAYVEDRLIGPNQWPSSLLVTNMRIALHGTGDDAFRGVLCRFIAREFFKRPVYPSRWPLVYQAAVERAMEQRTTPERVIEDATATAIALIDPWTVESSAERSFEQAVHHSVNDAVTEDFLGPHWRHTFGSGKYGEAREVEWPEDFEPGHPSEEDAILDRQFGAELIRKAGLTAGEREVLNAVLDGWSLEAWARERGLKPSGLRTLKMRACRKLRKAMGL
jgi:DNA-binding CsgD family transcriptional regulator